MDPSKPLGEVAGDLKEMNAATGKAVFMDEDDLPNFAVVIAQGQPETSEVLRAVERVEDRWHNDGSRYPKNPQEENYSNADHEDLLHALVKARGESIRPPNGAWLRRYYELTGEHYVLAQGFGREGTAGWVKKEEYNRIAESEDLDFAIHDEINAPGRT